MFIMWGDHLHKTAGNIAAFSVVLPMFWRQYHWHKSRPTHRSAVQLGRRGSLQGKLSAYCLIICWLAHQHKPARFFSTREDVKQKNKPKTEQINCEQMSPKPKRVRFRTGVVHFVRVTSEKESRRTPRQGSSCIISSQFPSRRQPPHTRVSSFDTARSGFVFQYRAALLISLQSWKTIQTNPQREMNG